MNYKEATGVRARGDLSPNPKPSARIGRMDDATLIKAAEFLAGAARNGPVTLRADVAERIADAILEVVNRG